MTLDSCGCSFFLAGYLDETPLALTLYRRSLKLVLNKLAGALLWVESSHTYIVRNNKGLSKKVQKRKRKITHTVLNPQAFTSNNTILGIYSTATLIHYKSLEKFLVKEGNTSSSCCCSVTTVILEFKSRVQPVAKARNTVLLIQYIFIECSAILSELNRKEVQEYYNDNEE